MWYPVDQSGECLRAHPRDRGEVFEEISCLYPTWGKTYFSFEFLNNNHARFCSFLFKNTWLPYAVCAIYFVSIFLGQKYMANRPAWNWRRGLAAWNLGLALFSMCGFARTAPQLAHNLVYYSWEDNLSAHPGLMTGLGSTGYWVLMFILSKFAELFDTFFIVIHKKKLMFLHWYHHITVLLFCWHSWVNEQPMGLIFCVVNYAVHSIMYFYYFLMAIKCKPKWFNPQIITVIQILQMGIGITVCSQAWKLNGPDSFVDRRIISFGFLMYASYLALFVQFFLNRYGYAIISKTKKAS